jgi:hypothetical protein
MKRTRTLKSQPVQITTHHKAAIPSKLSFVSASSQTGARTRRAQYNSGSRTERRPDQGRMARIRELQSHIDQLADELLTLQVNDLSMITETRAAVIM